MHPSSHRTLDRLQDNRRAILTQRSNYFDREALSLRPSGHPDRSQSCNNLAASLRTRFDQTGEESLLAEAIELHRESVSLRPGGHPDRSKSCNNLAGVLRVLFHRTGKESLLAETIELYREALSLRPGGHPGRSMLCSNLAGSLWTRFNQTGEESLLAEAIELHREALSLRPSGHPLRWLSCSNLGFSLHTRFEHAREEILLVEAINLQREALLLQTTTHPDRMDTCNGLIASHRTHFEFTGNEALLVEAIDLSKETLETQPQHHVRRWNTIIHQAHIYLNRRFSQCNTGLAIDYIQQAFSLIPDDWPTLLSEVAHLTSLIDLPRLSQDTLFQLLRCFSAAIDLASRVAGFVLDPQSQLRYLNSSQHLGPRAYWCAIACGQLELGLEIVEHARAMIWTQALHMRNPQLSGVPPKLASELEALLKKMHTLRAPQGLMSLSSHDQDARFKNHDRIHHIIQQVRALLDRQDSCRGYRSNSFLSVHPVMLL
jgi:tetratricopeptide (TPR) repeat protein